MGAEAGRRALARAGLSAGSIGYVIANCDTPFETIPATASLIAKELGIDSGAHMDVNSACSSFARHMKLLSDTQPSALPDFVLCVQTGAYTVRTDYSDRCVDGYIWGDGATAEVVSARVPGKLRVEPLIFEADPSGADEIVIDNAGHFSQNGAKVREFSIRKTCEMFETIAEAKNLFAETTYTVTHQANFVMQNSVLDHLNLPPERHLRNVHLQGNIAAAGCPSVLAQHWDKFKKGDQLIYAVLGSGLAWGGGYMEVG
jgi:3-oxoacyl-[acyl-carrier-protein] synthase-3